jgi:tetratricopeptide (TPR) repeat protein
MMLAALALLPAASAMHAQGRKPVPSTDEQQRLINEGNLFHDNQDFDGAISTYNEVLRLNPDNIDALFELATCYYDKGESRKSLATALRGVEYDSDNLGYFYILVGTNYDDLRQPLKAIDAYREGIKAEPNSYLLHYNLAVTYLSLKRVDEARASFKHALALNPNHASSHIGLGQIYLASGYRIPALLAFCRALILEPASGRAENTLRMVETLLGSATVDEEHPAIALPKPNGLRDEGNFAANEKLMVDVAMVGKENPDASQMEIIIARLRHVLAPLASPDNRKLDGGFAAEYYAPYFAELIKRGYLEAMAYHIFQSSPTDGAAEWLHANGSSVSAFLTWSKSYAWKKF